MTELVEGFTRMCSNNHPHELYGTYIGSVYTLPLGPNKGLALYIIEKGNGEIFMGTRKTVTVLHREDNFTETTHEVVHESSRSTIARLSWNKRL